MKFSLKQLFAKLGGLWGAQPAPAEKIVVFTSESLAALYPDEEPKVDGSEWDEDDKDDKEVLVFAGLEDTRSPVEGVSGEECWFGAYVDLSGTEVHYTDFDGKTEIQHPNGLVWLPYVTETKTVIDKLTKMQPGDRFIVTKGVQEGGMGCRVYGIELVKDAPRVNVPANRPPIFTP